jgi:secreted repeat protein with Y-X4-D motif
MQVTYNRHPLYRFAQDTRRGQTNGEGVNGFGAKWFVVSPAGTAIVKASTSSGGDGY